jgi:hypothetical protein
MSSLNVILHDVMTLVTNSEKLERDQKATAIKSIRSLKRSIMTQDRKQIIKAVGILAKLFIKAS